MAQLQKYLRTEEEDDFIEELAFSLNSGAFDNYNNMLNLSDSGLTSKKIVEQYLETGKFFDIDCPGGIQQLVKDYYDDKLE